MTRGKDSPRAASWQVTADGLFIGHSKEFFDALKELATTADAATPQA
jgi:hypothetical protein